MYYVYYFKARIKKKEKKVTEFFPLSLTTLLVLPVLIIGLEIELVKELTNSSWRKDNTFRDTTSQCITQYGVIDN